MDEQISGKHGPAEDDAIKRQDRDDLRAHGDEWPEHDAQEGEPGAVWAATASFDGTPPGQAWTAIELRSDLARHLDRAVFPANRARLLEILTPRQAEPRLLDMVSSLPADATFANLGELLRALDLPVEAR